MEADKRSAASGRAVPIKSTVGEIQLVKIHLRKTLQNKQMYARKTVCGDEFATLLLRDESQEIRD